MIFIHGDCLFPKIHRCTQDEETEGTEGKLRMESSFNLSGNIMRCFMFFI
jgi:hypothetical protein